MQGIAKKLMIYFMIGVIQLGTGAGIAMAGDPEHPSPNMQRSQNRLEDSLSVKIQQFRMAMKKNIATDDDMDELSGLLQIVLDDKGSIDLSPADIIGDDSDYELKYIKEITVNNHKQRIVQFERKQGKPPLCIYAQSMDKNSDILSDTLYSDFFSSKSQLIACNVLSANNKSCLSVILKCYGDEVRADAVTVAAYTLDYNDRMSPDARDTLWRNNHASTTRNMKDKYWRMYSIAGCPGAFWITNAQADSFRGNDFVVQVSDNKMAITLVDKNKQALDTMQAIFENGQWQPN